MRLVPTLLFAAALSACSQEAAEEPPPTPAATVSPGPSASPGRAFRYTGVAECPVLESNPEEAGYYLSECPGEGGYKLRVSESDLRQTVAVIAPGGAETQLDLAAVTGGGFSTLGDRVEWRGEERDGAFAPDALIVRHDVVTNPEGNETVSYLVAVRLAPAPCVVARITPGPEQNARARAAADTGGACLAGR